jgi:hypothetical protein
MTIATIPHRPGNKTTEDISKIVADFDAVLTTINGLLDDDNIANLGISLTKLKASGAAAGEVPVWSGTAWAKGRALLAFVQYAPASPQTLTTSTTANFVDIDATNLIFSFVAPPSGKVLVRALGDLNGGSSNRMLMNIRDSGGDVAGTDHCIGGVGASSDMRLKPMMFYKTGLTPGTTYNWKLGWKVESAGTNTWHVGDGTAGDRNPAYIEVWAVI